MKQYITIFVLAVALLNTVSCKRDKFEEPDMAGSRDVIYLWAGKPAPEEDEQQGPNKIHYNDGLGTNGKGDAGFKMNWEVGDQLYAILWDDADREGKGQATSKYIILTAGATTDGGSGMLFQGTGKGGLDISTLKGGEHFVLVHGHFVLDPNTDGGVIDFPTSEVTKEGYASLIHHGGVVDGTSLTFRNQDGTLANLKKHEYMIADAYVRFQNVTEKDENDQNITVVKPYLAGHKTGALDDDDITTLGTKENPDNNPDGVQMRSAHTLLRLTMFVPDDMFGDIDYRLLAVSLRTVDNTSIFHRYFRLHPNTTGVYGPNSWKLDWNDKADKESNIYFRANLPGTRRYDEINDPSQGFDQSKTVCVAGQLSGKSGHFVTLYFSLPSRPLALDDANGTPSETASNFFVTVFTRTHAFRSKKSYAIQNSSMHPGKIVNLNVSFAGDNYIATKAITDPNLGVTFAPGIVYATRADNNANTPWTYGIYENQGEYAGLDQQTDVMGDYFIFGSIDPRQVFHKHLNSDGTYSECSLWNKDWKVGSELTIALNSDKQAIPSGTTDVAALASVDGFNNIFSTMSKKEADRVWARIQEEAKQGINRGYYYYDAKAHDIDILHHTAHQAKGAWQGLDANDPRRQMSSTIGIWIGTNSQPSLDDQDKYVFLPSSNQLNNSTNNMVSYDAMLNEEAGDYEDAEHYRYWASKDYGNQHAACKDQDAYDKLSENDKKLYAEISTKHTDGTMLKHYYLISELNADFSATMKFSTNTRDVGTGSTCQRFQVWLTTSKTFTSSNIREMDQTFGRVVRPVIY